jgi:hypothetical protein
MITLRTKALLFLLAICGLGIGVLSPLSDGLYSAVLLFCFPFLVSLTALAIGIDLNKTPAAQTELRVSERQASAGFVPMPLVTSQKVN